MPPTKAPIAGPSRQTRRTVLHDRTRPSDTRPKSFWQPRGPRNGLVFVDFLCGAGGSSAGMSNAGWGLRFAANHWQIAINTHEANFPDVRHACVDVTTINLRSLPKANALWISPICTELSPAGGNGTVWKESPESARGQMGLLGDEAVDQPGFEKTRATFWEAVRYAETWCPETILVENVPDVVRKWALFKNWLGCMEALGYNWQVINVNSAHIGSLELGIPYAPQWRDRMYIALVRRDIKGVPDVTPRPMSMCFECREVVEGVQTWCKAANKNWIKSGRYRRDPNSSYGSYWYTCPRGCKDSKGRHARVEPYVLPAVAALDLDDLGTPLGDYQLKVTTLMRLAEGQRMFWPAASEDPAFVFNANHSDGDRRMYLPDTRPLSALTTHMGQGLVLPPYSVIPGGRWPAAPAAMYDPARTQLVTESEMVAFPEDLDPFIAVMRNNIDAVGIREPIPTVTSGGTHFTLVLPYHTDRMAAPPVEPLGTVLTKDRFQLIAGPGAERTFEGSDGGQVAMRDCSVRMLKAKEAARAQTIPVDDGYQILGTGEQQMMLVGNAVSSNAAQWLGGAVAELLLAA